MKFDCDPQILFRCCGCWGSSKMPNLFESVVLERDLSQSLEVVEGYGGKIEVVRVDVLHLAVGGIVSLGDGASLKTTILSSKLRLESKLF